MKPEDTTPVAASILITLQLLLQQQQNSERSKEQNVTWRIRRYSLSWLKIERRYFAKQVTNICFDFLGIILLLSRPEYSQQQRGSPQHRAQQPPLIRLHFNELSVRGPRNVFTGVVQLVGHVAQHRYKAHAGVLLLWKTWRQICINTAFHLVKLCTFFFLKVKNTFTEDDLLKNWMFSCWLHR